MQRWCIALLLGVAFTTSSAEELPFYLTLDTPPAPELSTSEALEAFRIAPGFTIELVAAEPLVEDPVAITWDEAGQLYIVEMRGFMPDAFGHGEKDPIGMVTRLTDTTGNGRYDSREVLLDNLVLPRALAIVNEGLLVAEPPNLWLCPSTSGRAPDIDCSMKQNIGTYGDQPGSVEHAENGLMMGLDNWLYSAKSNRRLQLRAGELRAEPTLFRGQWGIAQDNLGRLYYNTNSNLLTGDAFDAQQMVVAGNKGAPGLAQQVGVNDQLYAARINPGVNRAYVPGVLRQDGRLGRPTSASGMAVYRGDQLGLDQAQDVFVTEPAANAVVQLRVTHDGLNMSSEHLLYPDKLWNQVEFLTSTDERFRPVDVKVGPDGALYVIDMYRGIIQDHVFLTDQLRSQALERQLEQSTGRGRIWRVKATASALRSTVVDLGLAGSAELVDLLGHNNAWQRETAQRLLLTREDRKLNRQLARAVKTGSELQGIHALWTLSGRGALARGTVLAALKRSSASIRLTALRAGHRQLSRTDLLKLLDFDSEPGIKQQLILSLAKHNKNVQVRGRLVKELGANAQDKYIPSAVQAASLGQELPLLEALQERGLWTAVWEQQTEFVQSLVAQGFRAEPASVWQLLDYVQGLPLTKRWLQVAILDGLFDVTRDSKFERVELRSEHSIFVTQDEGLWPAIARARAAVTWSGDNLAVDLKPLSPPQQQASQQGAEYFLARCASCHGVDGQGITGLAPPLVGSAWVTGSSERLLRIVLHGLRGPIEVLGIEWDAVMPGHAGLEEFDDTVASGLLTYLHRSWGHTGRAIDPDFVALIRKQTSGRSSLWTVPELMALETNTHYRRYEGRYGRPGFALEFLHNGHELQVKSSIFNGPMVEEKEDHFFFEPRALRIEFVLADDGTITSARLLSADGVVEMPRLAN